jgi:TusA-related sulfurtransferase
MKEIDARGLACPAPVLQTKAAIERAGRGRAVQVVVDNPAAQQNVQRFMESKGYMTTLEQAGADLIASPAGQRPRAPKHPDSHPCPGSSASKKRTSKKS